MVDKNIEGIDIGSLDMNLVLDKMKSAYDALNQALPGGNVMGDHAKKIFDPITVKNKFDLKHKGLPIQVSVSKNNTITITGLNNDSVIKEFLNMISD